MDARRIPRHASPLAARPVPHPPLASLLRQAFNSFLVGKQTNELPPQPLGFSESEIAYSGEDYPTSNIQIDDEKMKSITKRMHVMGEINPEIEQDVKDDEDSTGIFEDMTKIPKTLDRTYERIDPEAPL